MSKLTCPYCFERFSFSEIEFRCLGENPTRCTFEPDHLLAKFEKLSTPPLRQRIFKDQSTIWHNLSGFIGISKKRPRCDCGERTWEVCPYCHNDLPTGFGQVKTKTIALIGAKESGKSNYIAVLIRELFSDNVGAKFDSSMMPWDKPGLDKKDTSTRYKENFSDYIYEKKIIVPETTTAKAKTNRPLIYKFDVDSPKSVLFDKKIASLMAFFDTAGEDLDHVDTMSTEAKYIANSDGILILLDPLQMPKVRNQVKSSIKLPGIRTEPIQIIRNTIDIIQRFKGLENQNTKIKIPLAVTFSKTDEIRHLFDSGSPIHYASNHEGYFDITDAETMSENIKAHLSEWDGGNINRVLNKHFLKFSYFGVSALGSSPEVNGDLSFGATPFRVADPILWILYQQGIISGKRSLR